LGASPWSIKGGFWILLSRRLCCKRHFSCIFRCYLNLATRLFLLPGNLIANLLAATKADDRMMIRTLINMLFWNVIVVVVGALVIYQ
jgi:hypothetical protein